MNPFAKLIVAALLLTGSVIGVFTPAVNPAPATTPATVTTVAETPAELSDEEAVSVALKHAGLTADEVRRIVCEYDVDDGVPQWEVEFRVGKMEYEYTIHAETGTILEWEKDWDD